MPAPAPSPSSSRQSIKNLLEAANVKEATKAWPSTTRKSTTMAAKIVQAVDGNQTLEIVPGVCLHKSLEISRDRQRSTPITLSLSRRGDRECEEDGKLRRISAAVSSEYAGSGGSSSIDNGGAGGFSGFVDLASDLFKLSIFIGIDFWLRISYDFGN
ncbi:hypothetical protein TIFTF001_028375 [Ficus carica]|uniref:Uncharacterized protein n=1 Tax=Ficus carica TaxID=3494 RepID=A0AA88DPW8_FICCA|nr:hypothetical protein TIFTF001_028375 [Ficus carica]